MVGKPGGSRCNELAIVRAVSPEPAKVSRAGGDGSFGDPPSHGSDSLSGVPGLLAIGACSSCLKGCPLRLHRLPGEHMERGLVGTRLAASGAAARLQEATGE